MTRMTKIVCTLGPAVDDDELLDQLLLRGMDVARLNFSHGTHDEQGARIDRLRNACQRTGCMCAILLDTKGPEMRTGVLGEEGPLQLKMGQQVLIKRTSEPSVPGAISCVVPELYQAVKEGTRLLIDDGLVALTVQSATEDELRCLVENDGVVGARKSINVPGVRVELPIMTDADRADLAFGVKVGVDFVAASFIRDENDVMAIREYLDSVGGQGIRIIAKIECASAVENLDAIIEKADGVMVARGDLGVEVAESEVPHIQKTIIRKVNRESKPVITATQMLDSMIRNPRPTRAEVADVASAIYDGTDAVMLSGETASGAYPLEALSTMVRIVSENERYAQEEGEPDRFRVSPRVSLATAMAAVETAEVLGVKCIIAPTISGRTARLVANLRPRVPVLAVVPSYRVLRQQKLSWGLIPLLADVEGDMKSVVRSSVRAAREAGLVAEGDNVVITAGNRDTPAKEPLRDEKCSFGYAATNVMQVLTV